MSTDPSADLARWDRVRQSLDLTCRGMASREGLTDPRKLAYTRYYVLLAQIGLARIAGEWPDPLITAIEAYLLISADPLATNALDSAWQAAIETGVSDREVARVLAIIGEIVREAAPGQRQRLLQDLLRQRYREVVP